MYSRITEKHIFEEKARIMVLESVSCLCENTSLIHQLINYKIDLETLVPSCYKILTKILSTSSGIDFINSNNTLETLFNNWEKYESIEYVIKMEHEIEKMLLFQLINQQKSKDSIALYKTTNCNAGLHLYGELAKTLKGSKVLKDRNVIQNALNTISNEKLCNEKRKAAIWDIGNIAFTGKSTIFIDCKVIKSLIDLIIQKKNSTFRGTVFYVFSLMENSKNSSLLNNYEWRPICLSPPNLEFAYKFKKDKKKIIPLKVETSKHIEAPKTTKTPTFKNSLIEYIADLKNPMTMNSSIKKLRSMKDTQQNELLKDIENLYCAYNIICYQKYPASTCKFILDLFDIEINKNTLKNIDEFRRSKSLEDGCQ